jgi:hypothetical protein
MKFRSRPCGGSTPYRCPSVFLVIQIEKLRAEIDTKTKEKDKGQGFSEVSYVTESKRLPF